MSSESSQIDTENVSTWSDNTAVMPTIFLTTKNNESSGTHCVCLAIHLDRCSRERHSVSVKLASLQKSFLSGSSREIDSCHKHVCSGTNRIRTKTWCGNSINWYGYSLTNYVMFIISYTPVEFNNWTFDLDNSEIISTFAVLIISEQPVW